MLKANTVLVRLLAICQIRHIPICNTNTIHVIRENTLYFINLNLITAYTFGIGSTEMSLNRQDLLSSVGRASGYKSQGCVFEYDCWQEFFILYFVAIDALL